MLIRDQIRLALLIIVALSAATLMAMYAARVTAQAHLMGRQDVQSITHRAVALMASSHQYMLFPNEASAAQWRARHDALAAAVADAQAHWPQARLAPLSVSLEGLLPLFALLQEAARERPGDGTLQADLQARRTAFLLERLAVETQATADIADRWAQALDVERLAEANRWSQAAVGLQLALVLALGMSAWRFSGLLVKRLERLRLGAQALDAGHLEHRSDDRRADEIGQVARALDAAAASLMQQRRAVEDANARLSDEVRARRRGESRLRLALDTLPAEVGYWDGDGRPQLANERLKSAVGPRGTPGFDELMAIGDGQSTGAAWRARAMSGQRVEFEHRRHAAKESDGEQGREGERVLHTVLVPERDASNAVVGFLSHTMDMTERHRLERRLREGERFLAEVTDRAPLELAFVDHAGVLRFANAAWCDHAGAVRDKVLGHPWSESLTPQEVQSLSPHVAAALGGRQAMVEWERGSPRRGDPESPAHAVERRFVPAGEGGGLYWIGVDVSERRRSEQLLSRMAALAPSGMLLVRADGCIRFANAEAARIFGYEPQDLAGTPLRKLVPEPRRSVHDDLQRRFFEQPVDRPIWVRSDLQGRRRDGSTVELEIGLSTIDTADGPAALAVVLDVGERRAQQQRLEAALEARETLLREFYHRIKNNLQMVHSLLRMQQRALPSGVARAALEDTARRVQAMALVHEQLRHAVQPAEVALDGYTAQLLTLAAESAGAGARGIRVEADVDALPVPFELAVPYGLLVNELVANALQHAFGSDGGIVTVCLREEGGAPRLRVCDDGRGLPPGFALTTLTTMGLQLASALAAQLGGTLEIEAPPGARGACFACTLQRLAVTAHAADSPSVAEAE